MVCSHPRTFHSVPPYGNVSVSDYSLYAGGNDLRENVIDATCSDIPSSLIHSYKDEVV